MILHVKGTPEKKYLRACDVAVRIIFRTNKNVNDCLKVFEVEIKKWYYPLRIFTFNFELI